MCFDAEHIGLILLKSSSTSVNRGNMDNVRILEKDKLSYVSKNALFGRERLQLIGET